ncbi:hypothetical protein [Microbacterium hominis]|uniref:hypothetical protein n=1 Tax=Microbacterium hominis TaxID=162426 RepID=UPI000A88183D|nr:hypothetical protein [Microbacterium hominis]
MQTPVHDAIAEAIRSDTFGAVWDDVLRQSHRALTLAATDDGAGVVVQTMPDSVCRSAPSWRA